MHSRVKVTIEGSITIDNVAAEVLHHMCSYDMRKWFFNACSARFSPDQISAALQRLGGECGDILKARDRAVKALNTPEVT